ncbi:MAG: hypothetical protein ACI8P3_004069 [Saprospiraceae bacterium]|jgi:hypothetical protein
MKLIQKLINRLLFLSLLLFSLTTVSAQNGRMYGLVDDNLVEIDPQTGALTQVLAINVPSNVTITNLAFGTFDCLFYGIINADSNPFFDKY